jgi:hypothetical protein
MFKTSETTRKNLESKFTIVLTYWILINYMIKFCLIILPFILFSMDYLVIEVERMENVVQ